MSAAELRTRHDTHARIARRRKARHFLVQALYQWHMSGNSAAEVERQFTEDNDLSVADEDYFLDVFRQTTSLVDAIDQEFAPDLDRLLDELDPVERALLRMATFELMRRTDVPFKVIIDEAVSLAKKFGASESFKYINAVLDRLATRLRVEETAR